MVVFQRISGYKKISFCRRCQSRMVNAKPSEIYCTPCMRFFIKVSARPASA